MTIDSILQTAFGWTVELLKAVAEAFQGRPNRGNTDENLEREILRIRDECGNNPDRLFERAWEEAENKNYRTAHAIFVSAQNEAEKWKNSAYPVYDFDKAKFFFYTLWSGIVSAYALRGEPAQVFLKKYNEKLAALLEEMQKLSDSDKETTQIVQAYLHYFMQCLEGSIRASHLQKVDSAFLARSADKLAHLGQYSTARSSG